MDHDRPSLPDVFHPLLQANGKDVGQVIGWHDHVELKLQCYEQPDREQVKETHHSPLLDWHAFSLHEKLDQGR
jgi:hypothetical protein